MKKRLNIFLLSMLFCCIMPELSAQSNVDILFEDGQFNETGQFFRSDKVDFFRIRSSVTDSVEFAVVVYKPDKPSPVMLMSHGWHMSVKPPKVSSRNPYPGFLTIQVDMRGRKYSTGKADCNGYELYDFYDAYKYALEHYRNYISDPEQVYYVGGSGGGGNGYGLVGKFPDLFCSVHLSCGISDYAQWYRQDKKGEFRDDMDFWIGTTPDKNPEAYASRSGITTVANVLTPLYIAHGETDARVGVDQARRYVEKARNLGKEVYYLELPGVGTRSHWGNITPEQNAQRKKQMKEAIAYHEPPHLPIKGTLTVGGYVVTKHFAVFMDSVDNVGEVTYNLKKHQVTFTKGNGKIVWQNKVK